MLLFTNIANIFRKNKICHKCKEIKKESWFNGPFVCRKCEWSMPTRRFFKYHDWVEIAIKKGKSSTWGK